METDAEQRIDEVVRQILDAGAVPLSERADLGEELAGHILERTQEYVEAGLAEGPALERAIVDFGGAATIGADLRRTYHSRLWVSTVGVLLPVGPAPGELPGVVRWVARGGGLFAVLSVLLGAYAALTMTPARAVIVGGSLGLGAVVVWLAAEALRRGQSWGWTVMTWVLAVESVILFTSFKTPGTTFNVSINGLIGFLLLIRLLANGNTLRIWVGRSGELPRRLAVAVAAVMLAWGIAPFAGPLVADPSQASEADIEVVASVVCGLDESFEKPMKNLTVTLDITWARIDPFPLGIAKAGEDWGDAVKVHITDAWSTGGPRLVDAVTGEDLDQNGAYGLTVPASLTAASFYDQPTDAGVDASVMRPGHTVRLTLVAFPTDQADQVDQVAQADRDYPSDVDIQYAHRDQFVLATRLACGGHGRLIPERDLRLAESWDLLTGAPITP
jgi:hypothetical protein